MSAALVKDFRVRSEIQATTAANLYQDGDWTDPKTQATFVVAKVSSNMLHVLADMIEASAATIGIDDTQARRNKIMEKNHALMAAAAAGNWGEFDKLSEAFVAEATDRLATGSDGTDGGSAGDGPDDSTGQPGS